MATRKRARTTVGSHFSNPVPIAVEEEEPWRAASSAALHRLAPATTTTTASELQASTATDAANTCLENTSTLQAMDAESITTPATSGMRAMTLYSTRSSASSSASGPCAAAAAAPPAAPRLSAKQRAECTAAKVDVRRSQIPSAGFGLFTTVARQPNEHILCYRGRRIDLAKCDGGQPARPIGQYTIHLTRTSFLDVSSPRAGVARFVNTARNTELSNNTRLVVSHKRGEMEKQAWLVASRPIAADTELLLSYGSSFHVPPSASPLSPLFHQQQQQQQQQSSSGVPGRLEAVSSLHEADHSLSPSLTRDAISLVLCFADDVEWDDFPVEIIESRELLLAAPFQLVRDNVILSVLRYPQSRSRGT